MAFENARFPGDHYEVVPSGGGPYYSVSYWSIAQQRRPYSDPNSHSVISNPGATGPIPRPATAFAQNAADFYGTPRPISFGRRSLQGRHIWASDIRWHGDAGTVDFAVAFGEQGVPDAELDRVDVLRIWANDRLIVDRRVGAQVPIDPSINFTIYPGNFTQNPDPLISESIGAAQAIAFRGTIYMVFRDFPLRKFGFNQIPFIRAEINDILTTTTEIQELDRFAGTPQNLDFDGAQIDWPRGRFYALDDEGGGTWAVHTYSIAGNTQIAYSQLPITPSAVGLDQVGYDPFFGYMLFTSGSSNSRPVHVVDPLTGQEIATFGNSSSNLTNDEDSVVSTARYAVNSVTGFGGETEYIMMLLSSLDDLTYLVYDPTEEDTTQRLTYSGYNGIVFSHGDGEAVLRGERLDSATDDVAVFYACDEREVYRITVPGNQGYDEDRDEPLGNPATYTVIHDVGAGFTIINMAMDYKYGHLLLVYRNVGGDVFIRRIEPTDRFLNTNESGTSATIFDVEIPVTTGEAGVASFPFTDLSGGTVIFNGESDLWVLVNVLNGDYETFDDQNWRLTGETSDRVDNFNHHPNVFWHSGAGYGIMISTSGDPDVHVSRGYPGRASDEAVNLSDALRWLALKSDLTAADIDIDADIDDTVIGGIVEQRVSYFDMVVNISQLYDFSAFESAGKIKMVRGAKNDDYAADFEVAEIDLCPINNETRDNTGAQSFVSSRRAEQSMPKELECVYIDPAQSYAVNVVRAKRTEFPVRTVQGENTATISVPLVLTASEALSRVTEALYRTWNAQITYTFRLGRKYVTMEPGDLVEVTHESVIAYMQVVSATLNADYSVSIHADKYATEGDIVLTQDDPLQDPDNIPSEYTELVVLDTNLIFTYDDDPNSLVTYAAALSGGQSGWVGGGVWASVGGFSYSLVEQHNTDPDLRGVSSNSLSAIPWGTSMAQDWLNSVTCAIINGAVSNVSSATHAELVANPALNLFAIGRPGRWEIVQVGTVTDDGDGVFTLSDIIRGLRGTEIHMNDHAAGDIVISLGKRPPITKIPLPLSTLDTSVPIIGLPVNAVSLFGVIPTVLSVAGNAEKPFAPTAVTAAESTGDIVIDWERRDRLFDSTVLTDGDDDPPMSEASELYDLDIYNAAGDTIVHSETDLADSTYTFTAAEITAAGFGSTPETLKVDVYQKSAVVGRGHRKQVTVDVL